MVNNLIISKGPKALFRAGLYILVSRKRYILKRCPSETDLHIYLMNVPREFSDPDEFINGCVRISLSHFELASYRLRIIQGGTVRNPAGAI
jgi:hypothetical protein